MSTSSSIHSPAFMLRFTNSRSSALALSLVALAASAWPGAQLRAQDADFIQDEILGQSKWREVGPAVFGGRIVDLAVHPDNAAVFYVAAGSGGVWKTTNAGASFQPVFDDHDQFSIGDIAVAPSNGDVLWIGTGEANNQRSSYWGNGVYRSTDGGKNFVHCGLEGSDHIGRIAVHPTDPDTAFVAALGSLYKPNDVRGLYKTTDGGKSWTRVEYVNQDVGFVDVVIDPKNPDNVYAASYERRRRAWTFDGSGPGSAVWRSLDGGKSFSKMTDGLPSGELGRIGLAIYAKDPKVVFAAIENANPRTSRSAPAKKAPAKRGILRAADADPAPDEVAEAPQGSRRAPRKVGGEIFRTDDSGKTWKKITTRSIGGSPGYYYGQICVDPNDDKKLYVPSVPLYATSDGGKKWDSGFASGLHVDHHAVWVDPRDGNHIMIGNDGGLGVTWDGGKHWDHINSLPIAQFYAIGVDNRQPYNIYGGTQDNGSWIVPTRGATARGLTNYDTIKLSGGDGFYCAVDPSDPDTVYSESQFGSLYRNDLRTGATKRIKPRARRGGARLRFNWMSPVLISPHAPRTIYFGSQFVHRSRDRGDHWQVVSPDLSTNDPQKLKGNVPHCTITTLAESPVREGHLLAGTDDGRVWHTGTGGDRWTELTDRMAGVPKNLWVSRVAFSNDDADTFYISFTGYREDDREPYLFRTDDGGETFLSIVNNLPKASINVVAEHPTNEDVLFVGTESGVYCTLDAGTTWNPIGTGLPPTPVHDLVVQARERDLVIGTHGRGMWTLDIAALDEVNTEFLGTSFHVFDPRDGHRLPRGYDNGYVGAREYRQGNDDLGARFYYYLGRDSDESIKLEVVDAGGKVLFNSNGSKSAGLHITKWNPGGSRRGGFGRGRATTRLSRNQAHQLLLRVTRGDQVVTKPFWVHADPGMGAMFFGESR